MKALLTSCFLVFQLLLCYSQNKQLLYNFNTIPQSLLLNPGTDINFKGYVGFPMLSGIHANIGSSGIAAYDLFAADNIDFNVKVNAAINSLKKNDAFKLNEQIDIINVGFKSNKLTHNDFYSFGIYQELDMFSYWPQDIATLLYEGNFSNIGKSFNLGHISSRAEMLMVYHFGINRKLTNKLTVGARAKLYNSFVEASSIHNKGSFITQLGSNNIYTHTLSTDIAIRTSGIKSLENSNNPGKELLTRAFLGGNLGVGFDGGFSYSLSDQKKITASVTDVGFIWYTKDVESFELNGSYTFEGIELFFPIISNNTDFNDYWEDLKDEIEENIQYTKNNNSYVRLRPIKLNASYEYNFGRKQNEDCNCDTSYLEDKYLNALGVQLFAVTRPRGPEVALTGFYYRKLFDALHVKATYTVDKYSFTNIGLGVSSQLGPINLHLLADNLLEFQNLANANTLSMQFGINYIIK